MKNLEDFGVQELNSTEFKNIDGGVIPLILLGAYVVDVFILSTMAGYAYGTFVTHNHD